MPGGCNPRYGHTFALRLLVLLTILDGVAAYGVPRIVNELSPTQPAAHCTVTPSQAPATWSLGHVRDAVSTSGMAALVGHGRMERAGLQTPGVAWSDVPPVDERAVDPYILPVDAGYELMRWSPGNRDHQAADLFVFASAGDAAGYVARAASARCRTRAASYVLGAPAGARAVVWTNPVGALQVDAFSSRGARAYWIAEVPATGSRRARAQLTGTAERLACRLRGAGR